MYRDQYSRKVISLFDLEGFDSFSFLFFFLGLIFV